MADLLSPTPKLADPTKVTSAMIKAALRAKFAAPAYQTFFEVGNDTGTKVTRHADAVSIGIWPSSGHVVHGFEIKVSRTDWLKEKADFGKSDPIYRFCHRWSLVVPAGLVKPDELPPTWGMMTYADGKLREAVQPKKLEPQSMTPGFVAALVRRAGGLDEAVVAEAVSRARNAWDVDYEARVKREIENALRSHKAGADEAKKFMAELEEALGERIRPYQVAELAAAIRTVRKSGISSTYDGLIGVLNTLDNAKRKIASALAASGIEVPGGPSS